MLRALLLGTGGLAVLTLVGYCAAPPKPVKLPEDIRTSIALAQRNYLNAAIAVQNATKLLNEAADKGNNFCKNNKKTLDINEVECK